ncbi:MAG TPA: hypothetical protein VFT87_05485, partial [Candidatus Saccharimonadales bacterium]|nr:hypothetical protein [Candidatus Saccharimonadales bacterium]
MKAKIKIRHHVFIKWLIGVAGGLLIVVLAVYAAFQLSPWPNALLIRYEFDKNGAKVAQALEKHVPAGIVQVENQQYQQRNRNGYLDVF